MAGKESKEFIWLNKDYDKEYSSKQGRGKYRKMGKINTNGWKGLTITHIYNIDQIQVKIGHLLLPNHT